MTDRLVDNIRKEHYLLDIFQHTKKAAPIVDWWKNITRPYLLTIRISLPWTNNHPIPFHYCLSQSQ